jgi:hypothetical protein
MISSNPYLSPKTNGASRKERRPRRLSLALNSQSVTGCALLIVPALSLSTLNLDALDRAAWVGLGAIAISQIADGILRRRVHRTRDLRFKRKNGKWFGLKTLLHIDADTQPGSFRSSLSDPSE